MRDISRFMATIAAALTLAIGWPMSLLFGVATAEDVNQVLRTGQVVEISDTTIAIREETGRYTYRVRPRARQALQAASIRIGDRVRVSVCSVWEIAYDIGRI